MPGDWPSQLLKGLEENEEADVMDQTKGKKLQCLDSPSHAWNYITSNPVVSVCQVP